ncbi:MAG: imidazolonepropionase [Candidatus Aminicenantes bacterium]|nr:imidazolonepropionase [Candidatus Aminicenantes bacterium]
MKSADLIVAGCTELITCSGEIPKRKSDLGKLETIKDGCVASIDGKIIFAGSRHNLNREVKLAAGGIYLEADGLIGLPGFIDPHTHLPFAGDRDEEFVLRLQGLTYQELAAKGMGIQTSVKATRTASKEELVNLCLKRLDSMLLMGTTTVEAKSGYGLNQNDEIKQLEALQEADKKHPVDIVPTYMGAHEIPPEYRANKSAYITFLVETMIPVIREKKLAEFFDVFCEEGVYSIEDTRILIRAAHQAGLKTRIHADEFVSLGGARLAAEEGAASADHLIAVSDEGIQSLAKSSTAATLLPHVSFFLMQEKTAPARRLIDEGAVVALATDFNPGSSMTESMLFILRLGVFLLKMSIEEVLNASTANAAFALRRHQTIGSLELEKKMDMVLCDLPNYRHLVYHTGINPVKHVIKNGRIVVKNGRIQPSP